MVNNLKSKIDYSRLYLRLHTTHYTLHTIHYTLNTTHCTPHTTHHTPHPSHYSTSLSQSISLPPHYPRHHSRRAPSASHLRPGPSINARKHSNLDWPQATERPPRHLLLPGQRVFDRKCWNLDEGRSAAGSSAVIEPHCGG